MKDVKTGKKKTTSKELKITSLVEVLVLAEEFPKNHRRNLGVFQFNKQPRTENLK